MTTAELKQRTKAFGLSVVKLVEALPKGKASDVVGRQLIRAATSVGANYRAACRARSKADFISKIGVVEEEADEALYWLEVLDEVIGDHNRDRAQLLNEANELTAIFAASEKTAKGARKHPLRVLAT